MKEGRYFLFKIIIKNVRSGVVGNVVKVSIPAWPVGRARVKVISRTSKISHVGQSTFTVRLSTEPTIYGV